MIERALEWIHEQAMLQPMLSADSDTLIGVTMECEQVRKTLPKAVVDLLNEAADQLAGNFGVVSPGRVRFGGPAG